MAGNSRPEGMSDIEWLVALEEIKQLKARRDRYADAHDWEGYESLHAPDHVSHNDGQAPWTSSKEMIENVRRIMGDMITIHHSYDPDIVFDTPASARGIWAMTGGIIAHGDDGDTWSIGYGYYHESYEKRDGRWVFTSRRWHRYFAITSDGVILPSESPMGVDAFDATTFGAPAPQSDLRARVDLSDFTASGRITIDAPPEVLYDFIADMPAMGDISPQCTGGEWRNDARGVGALFVGTNTIAERTWQAQMRVLVADRPREFAWENMGAVDWVDARPLVRWGYTFAPDSDGTMVEETWRILEMYDALTAMPEEHQAGLVVWVKDSIEQTLANLKAHFES